MEPAPDVSSGAGNVLIEYYIHIKYSIRIVVVATLASTVVG